MQDDDLIAKMKYDLICKLQSTTKINYDNATNALKSEDSSKEKFEVKSKNKTENLKMRSERGSKYRGVSKNGAKW